MQEVDSHDEPPDDCANDVKEPDEVEVLSQFFLFDPFAQVLYDGHLEVLGEGCEGEGDEEDYEPFVVGAKKVPVDFPV